MTRMKKVSVIIPTYNSATFLSNAIGSASGQTYEDFEIVVVDDGSTDGTEAVLRDYLETGMVIYLRQENKGPAAARNLGIRNCNGEFICFLDADDTLDPNSIQDRISVFERYPEIGLVFTDYRKIARKNAKDTIFRERDLSEIGFLDKMAKSHIRLTDGNTYLLRKDISHELAVHCIIWTGTVMVRRAVLDDVGYFSEDLRIAEDYDLWLRICRKYEAAFLDASTATYVMHDGSITKDVPQYCESVIKVYSQSLDPVHGLPQRYRRRVRRQIAQHFFDKAYYYWEREDYSSARREFRQAMHYDRFRKTYFLHWSACFLPHRIIQKTRVFRRRLLA